MRVITGEARGRPLKTVKGRDIRPTADRVKQSLFNVIGPRVPGSTFLDLFAGSGAVGIEALSRGAERCVFVELLTPHLQVVQENLTATGLADRAQLVRRDARAAAADFGKRNDRFNLIFIDPPYGQDLVSVTLEAVLKHRLLSPEGWVVCEHHRKDLVSARIGQAPDAGSLIKFRELIFGETVLSLYRWNEDEGGRQSCDQGDLSGEL